MNIKYCAVSKCFNSNIKTPEKVFFSVPRNAIIRKKWMIAIRSKDSIRPKTIAFCCEDHFDMEKDIDNFFEYNLVGDSLKLKNDILPHKFACQNRLVEKPIPPVIAKFKVAKLTNIRPKPQQLQLPRGLGTSSINPPSKKDRNVKSLFESDDESDEQTQSSMYSDDDAKRHTENKTTEVATGFNCESCLDQIFGFRYACVQCVSYNLCVHCEALREHADHYMLRIPSGKCNKEAEAVIKEVRKDIERIRGELQIKVERDTTDLQGGFIAVEVPAIKQEYPLTCPIDDANIASEGDPIVEPNILKPKATKTLNVSKRKNKKEDDSDYLAKAMKMSGVVEEPPADTTESNETVVKIKEEPTDMEYDNSTVFSHVPQEETPSSSRSLISIDIPGQDVRLMMNKVDMSNIKDPHQLKRRTSADTSDS